MKLNAHGTNLAVMNLALGKPQILPKEIHKNNLSENEGYSSIENHDDNFNEKESVSNILKETQFSKFVDIEDYDFENISFQDLYDLVKSGREVMSNYDQKFKEHKDNKIYSMSSEESKLLDLESVLNVLSINESLGLLNDREEGNKHKKVNATEFFEKMLSESKELAKKYPEYYEAPNFAKRNIDALEMIISDSGFNTIQQKAVALLKGDKLTIIDTHV